MSRRDGRVVYSSEQGRMCPGCGKPAAHCACRSPRAPQGDGIARVRRESKGRRGKTVTTISGLALPEEELRALAADLKRRCGSGGSVKDGTIEVQGDHVAVLAAELAARGHPVKP